MASSTVLPASMMAKLHIVDSTNTVSSNTMETIDREASTGNAEEVAYWTQVLRSNLEIATSIANRTPGSDGEKALASINEAILDAPRRKSARGSLASLVAAELYPAASGSEAPIIQYEKDVVMLRGLVLGQRRQAIARATDYNARHDWTKRIQKQGPWNEAEDPLSTKGAPSLPMPVEVSDKMSLAPFFAHLRNGGAVKPLVEGTNDSQSGQEPYYNVDFIEFEKGALYSDGRVDLCKMVTGPRNIGDLMESLKGNPHSRHFLLGNNIIGPTGAKAIASFIDEFPERFETWYLAGNCIDTASFSRLVDSMVLSPTITSVWLKRNPLGPGAAKDVYRLITKLPALRTLDLDQTELGDDGVAHLFNSLADHDAATPLALRSLYLNATGIAEQACKAIEHYLQSPSCTVTSLYMSNNPVGRAVSHLARGLANNATLERLVLQSCGLESGPTNSLIAALGCHPSLIVFDLGQGYATEDLGMRYNWLSNAEDLVRMIKSSPKLQYLNISYTPMTQAELNPLLVAVAESPSMLWFNAKPLVRGLRDADSVHAGQEHARLLKLARERLCTNVERTHGVSYEVFEAEHKRFLLSPKDVRLIDSIYRNRDAGMARRGIKRLEKEWEEGDETLRMVSEGNFV